MLRRWSGTGAAVGLSLPDAAAALDISERTAGRLWAYARAWLRREVEGDGRSDQES